MLKVLVWGSSSVGPCAFFRGGQLFDEPLAALGVEMRHLEALDHSDNRILDRQGDVIDTAKVKPAALVAMLDSGDARLDYHVDASDLEWADVLFFRRYYRVSAHDLITRAVWDVVERLPDKAIVYDCDDDLLGPSPHWNALAPIMDAARPLVRRMAARADLVTVSTPTLARLFGRLNANVRLVRNAVDASMYTPTEPRPEGDKARVLVYGNATKLRDFTGYPRAAVADHHNKVRTVFMGAERAEVGTMFDEVHPYVKGLPEFCRALGNLHPDVGMAPIVDDTPFDRSKSELHFLEFSAAGAATIAQRMGKGDGPYGIIRDGMDGVLAKGRQEWSDGLRRLLEASYRADVAGRARERVLTEYSHVKRAEEWADCLRWAADHRGAGLRAG